MQVAVGSTSGAVVGVWCTWARCGESKVFDRCRARPNRGTERWRRVWWLREEQGRPGEPKGEEQGRCQTRGCRRGGAKQGARAEQKQTTGKC